MMSDNPCNCTFISPNKFQDTFKASNTCKTNSPCLRSWATRTPIASVLKIKNSMPGLSLSKYFPRSLLEKWTLTSFCKSLLPLISIPASLRTVLPAPSVPTTILHLIFLSIRFPSLRKDAVTEIKSSLALMETHSCPINSCLSWKGLWLKPSNSLDIHNLKLRFSSCLSSKLISLYCEKCATEAGLTTCSKSDDKVKLEWNC